MDIAKAAFDEDIGVELILRSRTLNTHSRLQQLTHEQMEQLKAELGELATEFIEDIRQLTKSPTA